MESLDGFSGEKIKNGFDSVFNYLHEVASFEVIDDVSYNDRGGVVKNISTRSVRVVPINRMRKRMTLEDIGDINAAETSFFIHRDDFSLDESGNLVYRGSPFTVDDVEEYVWQGVLISYVVTVVKDTQ